ncbi:hypothetical protein VTJ83DRAFT_86 [Remersonia thermophila]|uniref:2'-phosphotransferase n=1 Tax=Remersonia thermophila TaxID=72144 RepID=A0ABR4DK45_9PEZI
MASAVAVPLPIIHSELGGVLPPSAVAQHSPRHGRSRAMSFKGGKNARQRRYSIVEERDTTIAKALMFVVKRAIPKEEVEEVEDEEEEAGEYLVADPDGWVNVADVLKHSRISALDVTLQDIQRILANATKARFDLRRTAGASADGSAEDASGWQISRITNKEPAAAPVVPVGDRLTAETPDLPEFVVFETSYQRYPLLLAQGAITRAPGGSEYRAFVPVAVDGEGHETVRASAAPGEAAEVSVWIHLRTALREAPEVAWRRSEGGAVVTSDDVPRSVWTKAVARRPDVGVLFEAGEVRKEVPAGLRGKGAKGKARKGKATRKRESSEEDSGSASEE